ncbi:MAG TPA: SDR family oxidoreductase, partial [Bacteroidales bacterium]|nr:SDR family oxidoreductase [Bacteroidales bacterium]
ASKAGIIGFTKSVAKEIGSRNIRCNAIAPGLIDTDMTQKLTEELRDTLTKSIALRRMGVPEDVAKVALFLASDLSQYITGQVIGCDGGM